MKICPNCGRATARTKDWACQWCGYPLISSSYKEIPQTYKELKGEERYEEKLVVEQKTGASSPAVLGPLPSPPELEPEPMPEFKPEPESELILEPEPVTEPEPQPVPELKPKPVHKSKAKPKPKSRAKPEPKAEPEPEPVPEPEPEPMPTEVGVNVEELCSAFEANQVAADARYKNRILRVTGLVYRTVISDNLDVDYIILTSAKRYGEWKVSSTFDKGHESELGQLERGQTVTVQGKYEGYKVNVLMRDCVLIR